MNALKAELIGRVVVMDGRYYRGAEDIDRLFLVLRGLGARPNAPGPHMTGLWLSTSGNIEETVDANAVLRFATRDEILTVRSAISDAHAKSIPELKE